jgi:hypothetical protein
MHVPVPFQVIRPKPVSARLEKRNIRGTSLNTPVALEYLPDEQAMHEVAPAEISDLGVNEQADLVLSAMPKGRCRLSFRRVGVA